MYGGNIDGCIGRWMPTIGLPGPREPGIFSNPLQLPQPFQLIVAKTAFPPSGVRYRNAYIRTYVYNHHHHQLHFRVVASL